MTERGNKLTKGFLRLSFLMVFQILTGVFVMAQYPGPVGTPGCTAIYKDSTIIIGWAQTCSIKRGYIDVTDTTKTYEGSNRANYGSYLHGNGPADDLVVSLGDLGVADLTFDPPIKNGPGADFAVFENSFSSSFLELAFVEVSSDGARFVRFPAVSLTSVDKQVGTFDTLDATRIHNFAGKYRMGYGTPFNLDDLHDSSGVDLNNIMQIRLIDVGGCIKPDFASRDAGGHIINDPWPTPFGTGGFDLDAVAVIHHTNEGTGDDPEQSFLKIFPNPFVDLVNINCSQQGYAVVTISDINGQLLCKKQFNGVTSIDLRHIPAGLYIARILMPGNQIITRKIIK